MQTKQSTILPKVMIVLIAIAIFGVLSFLVLKARQDRELQAKQSHEEYRARQESIDREIKRNQYLTEKAQERGDCLRCVGRGIVTDADQKPANCENCKGTGRAKH